MALNTKPQQKGDAMAPPEDDDPQLVETVTKGLQALGQDAPAEPIPEPQRRGDEIKSPESESVSAESTPDVETEDEPEVKPDEPVLPERFIRAAIHQGWEPERVQKLFEADPEMALQTFENIYESTNRLSQGYAQFGRETAKPQPEPQVKPQVESEPVAPKYKGVDLNKLREEHGDDPLVTVVEQLDGALKTVLNTPKEKIPTPVETPVLSPQPALEQDMNMWTNIGRFFGNGNMKEYVDVYGPGTDEQGFAIDWNTLNPGQRQNRSMVLERAEEILTGVEAKGGQMDLNEALNLAHLLVTEPVREQVIRAGLKSKVKQRNKGITLKPSENKPGLAKGGVKSGAQLETDTEARMQKLDW